MVARRFWLTVSLGGNPEVRPITTGGPHRRPPLRERATMIFAAPVPLSPLARRNTFSSEPSRLTRISLLAGQEAAVCDRRASVASTRTCPRLSSSTKGCSPSCTRGASQGEGVVGDLRPPRMHREDRLVPEGTVAGLNQERLRPGKAAVAGAAGEHAHRRSERVEAQDVDAAEVGGTLVGRKGNAGIARRLRRPTCAGREPGNEDPRKAPAAVARCHHQIRRRAVPGSTRQGRGAGWLGRLRRRSRPRSPG